MTFDKIKLDRRAVGRYLRENTALRAALLSKGNRVADNIRRDAPVDEGTFRDSFEVHVDETDRVVVRVVSTDPTAIVKEADSGVMLRALDAEAAT